MAETVALNSYVKKVKRGRVFVPVDSRKERVRIAYD